jgi:hypothetical protein
MQYRNIYYVRELDCSSMCLCVCVCERHENNCLQRSEHISSLSDPCTYKNALVYVHRYTPCVRHHTLMHTRNYTRRDDLRRYTAERIWHDKLHGHNVNVQGNKSNARAYIYVCVCVCLSMLYLLYTYILL